MKRILYVDFSSGFGGSSEALFSSLKYLSRNKFYPVVLINRQGRNFDRIIELGIKIISIPLVYLKHDTRDIRLVSYLKAIFNLAADVFLNSWRIWNVIKREKIDLIHINNNIKNNQHAILAAKWAGIPCVCHVRETRVLLKLERHYKRLIDRIVALNKKAIDILSENYDPHKVILIPDGHDLSLNVNENDLQKIRKEFSLEGKFCIGILGRLVEGKGQDDFIRAASIILKEHKNIKFLVVGNDPDQNNLFEIKLRSLAQELCLKEDLIFTGWRTDKNEIISVLDIVVQASSTFPEGTPLICLEAMALKKPVVATNIPGSNAMIADGVTGFLVPTADPKSLAAAIIKIIEDPSLARNMGEAGKCRVEKYFDIKNVVKQIENMYEGIFQETS